MVTDAQPGALRLLLLGHGRMGRLVEALAPAYGFAVAAQLDSMTNPGGAGVTAERCRDADVAIDFSTAATTVESLPKLVALGVPVVVGTTGWQAHEPALRALVARHDIGVVAAANFSFGVAIFERLTEEAARLLAPHDDYGAWIHEMHHAAKKDAPSGTAHVLQRALERGGLTRHVDVASTRAGSIPGTHTVGFDGPFESVVLTHTTRDRATFARGALGAARWVIGRRGWFTIGDVLFNDGGET